MIDFYPNQTIDIIGSRYSFMAHPVAPKMIYAQEGRKAIVYKVKGADYKYFALKVFKPLFREPRINKISLLIEPLSIIPGFEVANRLVVSPENSADLLKIYPDLLYSILMPWVNKSTWAEFLIQHTPINPTQSIRLAYELCRILAELELRQMAHTDISSSNILLDEHLLDISILGLENIYHNDFPPPMAIPAGTPGYAHPTSLKRGQWNQFGDRFSGAILLVEYISWFNLEIRNAAHGESFFEQSEMGKRSKRFLLMISELKKISNQLAKLFETAWFSNSMEEVPLISDWKKIISEKV